MQLSDAIRERRSIRKFKTTEVPAALISGILEEARWAPSGGNMQSWTFYVLTGGPLEEFKKANLQKTLDKEAPSPDVPMSPALPDELRRRYMEFAESMFSSIGVKREDKEARGRLYQSMATLCDAPCLIVGCIPKSLPPDYPMFDLGLITQTICLLAHDKGLGTLIMYAAVLYPEILRKIASIPEDRRIIVGVALGYPDRESPLNHFERKRAALSEFVTWIK
ncbi:MAG: nitroreductase [Deltaproteobacteria bacterium]|nr:nitroreductase [Deltaproteobacteria bacterium]